MTAGGSKLSIVTGSGRQHFPQPQREGNRFLFPTHTVFLQAGRFEKKGGTGSWLLKPEAMAERTGSEPGQVPSRQESRFRAGTGAEPSGKSEAAQEG